MLQDVFPIRFADRLRQEESLVGLLGNRIILFDKFHNPGLWNEIAQAVAEGDGFLCRLDAVVEDDQGWDSP